MERADLEKLTRIRNSVNGITVFMVRLNPSDPRVHGFTGDYRSQYELIKPIIGRYLDYQLEFGAIRKPDDISVTRVTGAFVGLQSFLDSVIKQESLSSQTVIEEIKEQLFIDDNKPFSAYKVVTDILNKTTIKLKLIDNYLEASSLHFLSGINTKAELGILTKTLKPNDSAFKAALSKFITQ